MKKLLVALGLAILLSAALWLPSSAGPEAPITATVTVQNVSVTVSPTTIDYGTLAFEATKQSGTTAAPTFTATNNGNVNEDLKVRGANATKDPSDLGGAFTWTIQTAAPVCPDPNKFRHSVKGVSAGPVDDAEIFMTTVTSAGNLTIAPLAASATKTFNSKLYMPCSGSSGLGQKATTSITVVATASP